MSTKTRPMTALEFLAMPDDGMLHELIRGEVTTMPLPGWRHGAIAAEIGRLLANHVKAQRLGRIYAAETGFLIERDPDTVRGPDVSFVRQERLAEITDPERHVPFAPDLAVEMVSPSDRPAEVAEKVAAWLSAGTRVVWVIEPGDRTVTVHVGDQPSRTLQPDDTLDGGDCLPGFTCAVADLFE
jgi:Uma2 family endonuclease